MNRQLPELMLGTAMWGWTISRTEAFKLLDAWLKTGRRAIDAATNYPINKNPADFRASEKILLEYILAHGLHDLNITMKIGSLDNMRTPEVNLSPSFILMMAGEYRRQFGDNLQTVMFHWDNRDSETDIHASLEALAVLQKEQGLNPGLSGIAHPELYALANADLDLSFDIQMKHNVLQSDYLRYAPLQGKGHRFFAYGINAGGVKLESDYESGSTFLARGGRPENVAPALENIRGQLPKWNQAFVRPPVKTINQLGLIYAALNENIQGILLGLSSLAQMEETLDFYRNLDVFDYSDVFKSL